MSALAACQAYLGYSDLLAQLPPEVDYSDAQAARLWTLVKDVLESEPQDLKELAAKITMLERVYEGSETTAPFKNLAADIRRLAGED